MKTFCRVWIVIFLFSFIGTGYGKSKDSFKIKSISDYQKRSIIFIHVKYKCGLKSAENITIKIYAFLKKSKKNKTVACGTFNFPDVNKGYTEEIFMINSSDTKNYGSPKKYHAEIWYKDKLAAEKSKSTKDGDKWWKKDEKEKDEKFRNIIVRGDWELERQVRRGRGKD